MGDLRRRVGKTDIHKPEHMKELGYEVTGVETVTTNTIKGFGVKIIRKTKTFWKYKVLRNDQ